MSGWVEWRGGGVTAIVAGCNQSSANTGTRSHTYTHQRSSSDRPVPSALPPSGCDTLIQITCCRGQRGASWSARRPSSSPLHKTCTHMNTHGFLSSAVIIAKHLIQGWEETVCRMCVWHKWVCGCGAAGKIAGTHRMWICMHCIHTGDTQPLWL